MEPTTDTRTDAVRAVARLPENGRQRLVVERVSPEIDGGRFPIKRTVGESVVVSADLFADGHDVIAGVLRYRALPAPADGTASEADTAWQEVPLHHIENDRWGARFSVEALGRAEYTIEAWVDHFGTWLKGLIAKAEAGQDVSSELLEGAELIQRATGRVRAAGFGAQDQPKPALGSRSASVGGARRGAPDEKRRLQEVADTLRSDLPQRARVSAARDPELQALMDARPDRSDSTTYARVLSVIVDPVRARYGAWYEMFPRSITPDPTRGGTFREAETRLPEIAAMGFEVLYLPPVHPIGTTHRKGRNNTLKAEPGDPGSPWAIGSPDGGHTGIDLGLGTIDDFDRFVRVANRLGLEVALDIAFQASPDHPWVREHPEWFRHRPDGTIKYAENPPKRYQDIYPINFESSEWEALWAALRDVFLFWVEHGVKIFRVDNPHTKPFRFWEWCIAEIQRDHPDTIFLAEAFTRPKVMRYLAKCGFSQSYTYYTWRNQASELREYLTELTRTELQEYMRPNFFVNTPDILHEYLVHGGRPAFEVRVILAATLAASYGIYSGYELCENVPVRPGSEEYLDSEKYQIKVRDYNAPGNLNELIARVNQIRREFAALQQNATLAFHATDNPTLLFYSKSLPAEAGSDGTLAEAGSRGSGTGRADARHDRVFVVASTDPRNVQHGWVQVPTWELGLTDRPAYVVEDLLDGARYTWHGEWNYVRFEPSSRMAHIFVIRDS
jgi:starch synthase (maltosyl-transferring)